MAVALLLVGGAAALYLHGLEQAASGEGDAEPGERTQLEAEADREVAAVGDIAEHALFDALDGNFTPAPDAMALLGGEVEARLAEALDAAYPRLTTSGHEVNASLVFARAVSVEAGAALPSPFGGRGTVEIPAYLGVEGVINVTVEGSSSNFSALRGIAARVPIATLLPVAIAKRMAAEAGAGGRVERLVGQFAQRSLQADPRAILDPAWDRGLVELALGVETSLQFGASGNASVDARMNSLFGLSGAFDAAALVATGSTPTEPLFVSSLGSIAMEGGAAPANIVIEAVAFDGLVVGSPRLYFDGGELGGGAWAAIRVEATGTIAVTARVSSDSGSVRVGPITLPVSVSGRAFMQGVPDQAVASPSAVADVIADMTTAYRGGSYYDELTAAGEQPNKTGFFRENKTMRALAVRLVAEDTRAALPPLEDIVAFEAANTPQIQVYHEGAVAIDAELPQPMSRAQVAVDGMAVGTFPVVDKQIAVERLPEGHHKIQVEGEVAGSLVRGGGEVSVGSGPWNLTLLAGAESDSALLRDALDRAEGRDEPAGMFLLGEAGAIVGLAAPQANATVTQIARFAADAESRLAALDLAGATSKASAARIRDARAVVGITLPLVQAAGMAYENLSGANAAVGNFAGSLATLVLTGDPNALLSVSINAIEIVKARAHDHAISLSFTVKPGVTLTRNLPLDQTLLVFSTVAGALTLCADFVKIEGAWAESSTATFGERALLMIGTGLHLGKITLGVSQAVYKLTAPALARALEPTFKVIGIAFAAAMVVFDLASLYTETDGNWTKMAQTLVSPDNVLDLLRLPSIIGATTSVLASIYFTVAHISAKGGPVGTAIALFVLAALLVANKEDVASAIFGTMPYDVLGEVRKQVGSAIETGFSGAAAANSIDLSRAEQARRALSVQGALSEHAGHAQLWRTRASDLSALIDAARRLSFASRALVEQADDFASLPYSLDEGRHTEGYRALQTLAGSYNYSGDVAVNVTLGPGLNGTLGRADWRALLGTIQYGELETHTFGYRLTETNGIPQKEFEPWSAKLAAAGNIFTLAAADFQIAAEAIGAA